MVAASTGNHGQGIAYGAGLLGVSATICVPRGNNPEKNAAMRALGATVVEEGRDYDEAVVEMLRLAAHEGRVVAHSTNDRRIVAGAATMTLEILEQKPDLDALVIAVGGGSQAVGAMTVARALAPSLEVYGVQAAGASAIHDSWHARTRLTTSRADTFADGVATRHDLRPDVPGAPSGVGRDSSRSRIRRSPRVCERSSRLRTTSSRVRPRWASPRCPSCARSSPAERVGIIFCGGNIDTGMLRRILSKEM